MRRSASVLAALLAAALLSGCTGGPSAEDRPVNLKARVFLSTDASDAQAKAVETHLRGVPDITGLTFITRELAYERMRADLKDRPDLLETLTPGHMPQSYEFTMPTRRIFERTYQGPLRGELRKLDGVDSIVFPGRKSQPSVDECVMSVRTAADPAPKLDIVVFLMNEASEAERQAVQSRLRAVPGASDVRLRSREEGYEILKESYRDVAPEIAASAKPEDLPEALVLTMVDRDAVFRANDDRIDEQVCRLTGVERVIVPPKPLARRHSA
ncbi:permease-like cell division protein FtsX [Micromonospora sp. CPCC 206171]|uniref:permease-like cell division protein FtsX n=1 Tax=Micromonospora sp. CPCC 206171 TaxID=3122405 RepID=UPI002FEEABB5